MEGISLVLGLSIIVFASMEAIEAKVRKDLGIDELEASLRNLKKRINL